MPPPLRDRRCHATLARTLWVAYNIVKNEQIPQPDWHGKDVYGNEGPAPMIAKYDRSLLVTTDLRYQNRPLLTHAEWLEFVRQHVFADRSMSLDLERGGFTHSVLDELWNARDSRSPPAKTVPQALQRPLREVWQCIYINRGLWHHRTIPQIANAIYQHCYLGLPRGQTKPSRKACQSDISYLTQVQRMIGKPSSIPALDAELPAAPEFFETGAISNVRCRMYVHATASAAPGVMQQVLTLKNQRQEIVGAKIANPLVAGLRPDTVVVYLDCELNTAALLAGTLAARLAPQALATEIPLLTHCAAPGIGVSWDPQAGKPEGHSFGTYHAGILAEAFYDTVANVPSPGIQDFGQRAMALINAYGLRAESLHEKPASRSPDDPPMKAGDSEDARE